MDDVQVYDYNAMVQGPFKCYVTQLGGGWVSAFLEKSVTEVYDSTLLALRGGGVKFPGKESYVTLEWLFRRYLVDRHTHLF